MEAQEVQPRLLLLLYHHRVLSHHSEDMLCPLRTSKVCPLIYFLGVLLRILSSQDSLGHEGRMEEN